MKHRHHRAERKQHRHVAQTVSPAGQEVFAAALQYHQAGRLQDAERLYHQILTVNSRHSDALHLLGVIALQTGQTELAADRIGKAIAINPNIAAYHSNRGAALSERGQLDEAVASYRRAIALKPDYPDAHNNLGTTLREQGQLHESIACYHKALRLKPDYPEAHFNLGISLAKLGQSNEAIRSYRKALDLRPDVPGGPRRPRLGAQGAGATAGGGRLLPKSPRPQAELRRGS